MDRAQYLDILADEVMRLDGTVSELLDYAAARPGKGRCRWTQVWGRVEKLLRAALPHDLALESGGEDPALAVSPGHLQQILLNLVRNAARAACSKEARRKDGRPAVRVRASAAGGRALIEVADTGPGVPADMLPRLFAPFATASEGGTGLGLATVRRLAELYGGRAWAENGERGARFFVELPTAGSMVD